MSVFCWPIVAFLNLLMSVNKIIMKVSQERNPYLKRIYSQTPHKYSYHIIHTALILIVANIFYQIKMAKQPISIPTALLDPNSDPTSVVLSIIKLDISVRIMIHRFFTMHQIQNLKLPIITLFLINFQAMPSFHIKCENNYQFTLKSQAKHLNIHAKKHSLSS